MLNFFRKSPPVDPSGFTPGDLIVTIQKRDKLPVWARSSPRRIKVGGIEAISFERHYTVGPNDVLMYVSCVEEPAQRIKLAHGPSIKFDALLFLNVIWKHGSHWISSEDAEFMLISD